MVGNRFTLVLPCIFNMNNIRAVIIYIQGIFFEPKVGCAQLHINRIPRAGIEFFCRHTDNMPAGGIGDIVFHQVDVKVGRAVGIHHKVQPARRIVQANLCFDPQLVIRIFQLCQIEKGSDVPFDQRPIAVVFIFGSIHRHGRIAVPWFQRDRSIAVAGEQKPALDFSFVEGIHHLRIREGSEQKEKNDTPSQEQDVL